MILMDEPHPPPIRLPLSIWQSLATQHRDRAAQYTMPARHRKDRGLAHPIQDFLFNYYPFPLASLENWHPGLHVWLEWHGDELPAPFTERHYHLVDGWIQPHLNACNAQAQLRYEWIRHLLISTQQRPAWFGCHGLHEWAMVYEGRDIRHEKTLRLRLPQSEIDAVVKSRVLCCTHYDAFRFFAKSAQPLNRTPLHLEDRPHMEQAGCVHANMDLYKWTSKCMPWVPSNLLLDCFELALDLRDLDMRASPYDLSDWGRPPVCIETPAGRAVYEHEQKTLSARAAPLRTQLIEAMTPLATPLATQASALTPHKTSDL